MSDGLPPLHTAPQHGPRPLPLFIDMLREQTAGDPAARAAALAGLSHYQAAPRVARPVPRPETARAGRASLLDYGGAGVPIVFVPSLINPPFVLDLTPDTSLLGWLAARGHRVLLVDWGDPTASDRDQDIAGHVEALLLPLLATLGQPCVLVGYCLGGTIALGAAAAADMRAVGLIATPWHFAGFEPAARDDIAALWAAAQPACEAIGLVPVEVLQAGFWRLDPARTVAKFAALADADARALAAFVALEDWANAGAPLTLAAGREMFEGLFGRDDPGGGRWCVAGRTVDPAALGVPIADFVSTRDRIVPAATSAGVGEHHEVDAGHVGMIVGSRARALLWEPLAHWLSTVAAPK